MKILTGRVVLTCDPLTIAATASVAAAATGAFSAYTSGKSANDAAKYNAEMQRRQAADALQRGAIEAGERRDEARRVAARQVDQFSTSGVLARSGTPLALLTETAGLGELDAQRTLNNAQREASGLEASARLERYQGKMAKRGGILNAAGTLLGGASNAYFGYNAAKTK